MGSSPFAIAIGLRAAIVGGIVFAILQLLPTGRDYATILVLAGVAIVVLIDMARSLAKADRLLERFIDGLKFGELERPAGSASGLAGFRRLTAALERRSPHCMPRMQRRTGKSTISRH